MSPDAAVARRMDPERRREQLLEVAAAYISEHGIGVSLDDIARAAKVSPPLMRHYFRNRDGLLVALVEQGIDAILQILVGPSADPLGQRLRRYLVWSAERPWMHRLWVASAGRELAVAPIIAEARRRLVTVSVPTPQREDPTRLFRAAAWVAVIESAVQAWLDAGAEDVDVLVDRLLDVALCLGVATAREATDAWPQ